MDDEVVVGVLDAGADPQEELQPLIDTQMPGVAMRSMREPSTTP